MRVSAMDETYRVWTDKELLMISRLTVKLVLKRSAVPDFNQRDLRKCMKFIKYISDYDIDMYVYSLDQLLECMYQFGTYSSAFIKKCGIIQKERAKYDEF